MSVICPKCHSREHVCNGKSRTGKQRYRCKECNRYFVENPKKGPICEEKKAMIEALLLEKIPLAGICRVVKVSHGWLQNYVNEKYQKITKKIEDTKKKSD